MICPECKHGLLGHRNLLTGEPAECQTLADEAMFMEKCGCTYVLEGQRNESSCTAPSDAS